MEIVEKQVEKIKEVPYGYWDNHFCGNNAYLGCGPYSNRGINYSGGSPFASKGLAGTALGLSIGALAWTALKNNGFNLFGNGSNVPENVNINTIGTGSHGAPSTFSLWEKECADTLANQKAIYDLALLTQNQRFSDRQSLDRELFGIYKSQVDADFGLYKSTRDSFDVVNAKQDTNAFALYKSQRDADDALAARISALETKQAVNDAVDPWRAKVLDMKINGVAANAQASVALEAERRCCADNKIVSYVNGNFYPVNVADITPATTSTARELYNPLCGCCNPCIGI